MATTFIIINFVFIIVLLQLILAYTNYFNNYNKLK